MDARAVRDARVEGGTLNVTLKSQDGLFVCVSADTYDFKAFINASLMQVQFFLAHVESIFTILHYVGGTPMTIV